MKNRKMEKIIVKNHKEHSVELIIEPLAESFSLKSQEEALIEIEKRKSNYKDPLIIEYDDDSILIYECRQTKFKITVSGELKYYTPDFI